MLFNECREMAMNGIEGNGNMYSTAFEYGMVAPLSGTTTVTETLLPIYGSMISDSAPVKTVTMKSDSGRTYAVPISRKRSRDEINLQNANNRFGSFTFLGEDISFQIQQQQSEFDRFIAQHVRLYSIFLL